MMYDSETAKRHIDANRATVSEYVEHYGGFGRPSIPTVTIIYPNGALGYLHFWDAAEAKSFTATNKNA
jgi:hypothetical protein